MKDIALLALPRRQGKTTRLLRILKVDILFNPSSSHAIICANAMLARDMKRSIANDLVLKNVDVYSPPFNNLRGRRYTNLYIDNVEFLKEGIYEPELMRFNIALATFTIGN